MDRWTRLFEHAQSIVPRVLDWGHRHRAERLAAFQPLPRDLLPSAQEFLWDLEEWRRALERPRLGLYGASQAGKSTFVDRLLFSGKGESSPFATRQTISYLQDINPPGGGLEATAVVTRFVCARRDEEVPILKLGERRDILGVLTAGFHLTAELDDPEGFASPPDLHQLEDFLHQHSRGETPQGWADWRDDILRTYQLSLRRFGAAHFPIEFRDLFVSLHSVPGLPRDRSVELAAMLLWRGSANVRRLFEELSESPLMHLGEVRLPWSILRLVLSRVLPQGAEEPRRAVSTKNFGRQSWEDYGLVKGDGPARIAERAPNPNVLNGLVVHAFATELRIPVNVERLRGQRQQLLAKYDLVDFPGSLQHSERYAEGALASDDARLGLVERGRVDYSFLTCGAMRPVDVLLFLQKYGNAPEAQMLSRLLDPWLKFWKGPKEISRSGISPNLFASISHFDSVLKVLAASGEHDLERFFRQNWRANFPDWISHWVGSGAPMEQLYWLAMTTTPVGNELKGQERAHRRAIYEKASAISNWIGDPARKWDLLFDDESGGVDSIVGSILSFKTIEDFVRSTHEFHVASRLAAIAQLLQGALPEVDSASNGDEREQEARSLSERFFDGGAEEKEVLRRFASLRQAFEVPVLKMSAPPGTQANERLRLWYRELINDWAVSASKRLAEVDKSNAERWEHVVGWLRQALSRKELESHFVKAVGIVRRNRSRGEGGIDLFPRFAAALVSDQFFRASVQQAARPEPTRVYDSSEISWKNLIRQSFVEALAWHARESANVGDRPRLPGDDEGLGLYRELRGATEGQFVEEKGES
jgi:hypothetical protein